MLSDEQKAMLLWKLGPGDMNKAMRGESPIPRKKVRATAESWQHLQPMPEHKGRLEMGLKLDKADVEILKMGHIPEVMEDHWFMYSTDDTIKIYRSWTGICIFEAHFKKDPEGKDNFVQLLLSYFIYAGNLRVSLERLVDCDPAVSGLVG